jgi:hypothetical protein
MAIKQAIVRMELMTISQINAACAPYEVTGRTTLGTVYRQCASNETVLKWIEHCLNRGADYDTDLNDINDICGRFWCPFEGEVMQDLHDQAYEVD